MVQMSTEECSSSKLSVLSKSKNRTKTHRNHFLWATTTKKDLRATETLQQSCTNRPLIHCCDSRLKPRLVPTEPRSIDSLETFPNECVSRLSYCTEHLCPDTHFIPRIAFTKFTSSPSLPKIGDYSHCSFSLLIPVLTIFFVTNRHSFVSVQHQAAPMPQLLQSFCKQ